jgi:hypothetical protein
MEQEILFRGLDLKGNWIYGGHAKDSEGSYILVERKNCLFWVVPVKPETVGIFSTTLDKNKTKMFHGDIFKLGTEKGFFEVRFIHGCSLVYKNGKQYGILTELKECFLEVVGNTTDNPELLND